MRSPTSRTPRVRRRRTSSAVMAPLMCSTALDGTDILSGQGGADTLKGGEGDDLLSGGFGLPTPSTAARDRIRSVTRWTKPRIMTARTPPYYQGVEVDLSEGKATVLLSDGTTETDTLKAIENAIGTAASDTLTGDGGDNVLIGKGGRRRDRRRRRSRHAVRRARCRHIVRRARYRYGQLFARRRGGRGGRTRAGNGAVGPTPTSPRALRPSR